jgi:hypothetical protein
MQHPLLPLTAASLLALANSSYTSAQRHEIPQLNSCIEEGKLAFHGQMAALNRPAAFEALCRRAAKAKWVVFAKAPFGGPEQVLKYLARYTHRVAISNSRILSIEDGKVAFQWKDYADGNTPKVMTLTATEFIRRFLLHVLPAGFVRIRQYGFLANRARGEKLALCRALLGVPTVRAETMPRSNRDEDTQRPIRKSCPICKTGYMIPLGLVPAAPPSINSS